jgi:hypothetical protein
VAADEAPAVQPEQPEQRVQPVQAVQRVLSQAALEAFGGTEVMLSQAALEVVCSAAISHVPREGICL